MPLPSQYAAFLADVASVALCLACAVGDLRSYRIPNRLTFGGVALGLGLAASTGSLPLAKAALAGLLIGFFALLPARVVGAVGMGDVKLLAAVGALVRFPLVLPVVIYTLLWGGLFALVLALRLGVLGATLRNLLALSTRQPVPVALHRMPYGLAIFAGTAHAVLSRYLPGLALW
jgi:prepilin peptidase CpaA